jgi:N-acetylmuramoyl-L-alanine amidase
MRTVRAPLVSIASILAFAAACTSPARLPAPAPSPAAKPAAPTANPPSVAPAAAVPPREPSRPAPLPPIPLVEGPVAVKVQFPSANEAITVRDSNFIFGSVGNGHAELTINGTPVPVAPNGAFLAFLPVPPATAPRYELFARTPTDSSRVVVRVRVPPPRPDLSTPGRLMIDSSSVAPRGGYRALRDDELVRVSVRASSDAEAAVVTGGMNQPLVYLGGNLYATDVRAVDLRNGGQLVVSRGTESVRMELAKIYEPRPPHYVMLGDTAAQRDTDAYVIGRPTPGGTYKWMFVPGTIVLETGRVGDNVRVRLDSQLEVWVDSASVKTLVPGYPAPHRTVGPMSVVPSAEWVDLVLPISSAPPFLVEQDTRHVSLTLYGTQASPETIKYLQNEAFIRVVNWVPVGTDRMRLDIELARPPFGYLVLFEPRGFILRIRRPPRISAARPLEGLTITVDPGHPPGGALGPTGLTEAEGVLPVAFKLRDILESRGAHVVMTRTTMDPVDLHLRSVVARRANAAALVSIHLNAFGDGVDPFPNAGTSTLFFHPQTEPLARLVQSGMQSEMGLRDLGVHYQNIAIGRTTWMPSLICEGAFLMIPEQENALRIPEFQERYARGVADGIEAYFRSIAQ